MAQRGEAIWAPGKAGQEIKETQAQCGKAEF